MLRAPAKGGHLGGMKLEIDWTLGRKHSSADRLFLITTKQREPITAFRLALLTNQLAYNELKIHGYLHSGKYPFFFKELIHAAIDDAKTGVNWAEPKNEAHIIELCKKYQISSEKIDFDLLRRTQQRQLEEFRGQQQ